MRCIIIYPNLDPDLNSLVVQCCAFYPQDRPTMEDLHARARRLRWSRDWDHYRNAPFREYEKDAHIRRLLQKCILDAAD
ncbi:hypothetical protein F5Y11DRAFT_339190, partial [Daldinia sp. FL1419]